jgi:uncharacterized spore protein YtfJ
METKTALEGAESRSVSALGGVLERVAERLAGADVRTVYGSPIERDAMTVIPVAKVRYGFGGGAGRKRSGRDGGTGDEGSGGGGGVNVTPVGFIEMCHDKVRFRRIRAPAPALTAFGVGFGLLLLARVLRAAFRAGR